MITSFSKCCCFAITRQLLPDTEYPVRLVLLAPLPNNSLSVQINSFNKWRYLTWAVPVSRFTLGGGGSQLIHCWSWVTPLPKPTASLKVQWSVNTIFVCRDAQGGLLGGEGAERGKGEFEYC